MTRRHDEMFSAVLSGVPDKPREPKGQGGARFLRRGNAISERLSGEQEEKTLRWVDPSTCRMWERHNRDYGLLTEDNCRDLIEGIKAQGQQEFPAIVRRIEGQGDHEFEVICGARRHFAVSWLRANNYPQFKYLIEVRSLSDEEAFRLSDIENRGREDISDYERAKDYAEAVALYYGGKQKAMAERLEVTQVWLSRYLELAKLPHEIVAAFPSIRDIREIHARVLKPLLKDPGARLGIMAEAKGIAERQAGARDGVGAFVEAQEVIARLKAASAAPKPKPAPAKAQSYRAGAASLKHTRHGKKHRIEFEAGAGAADLEAAFKAFLQAVY